MNLYKIGLLCLSICVIIGMLILMYFDKLNIKIFETFESNRFNVYRLGDIIRHMDNHVISDKYLDLHKNTIGYEYAKNTNKKNDYKTLKKICDKRKNDLNDLPKQNELIIHVRLGDVIEKSIYTVDEYLEKERVSKGETISSNVVYIKSRKFFENYILNEINKIKDIDTVIFVGGDHRNLDSLNKSNEYLQKVSKIFRDNGYKTHIKFNEHTADEDFVYLSNAKYYVPTGGGFSKSVMEMVKLNNNIVYDKYLDLGKIGY